MKYSIITVAYNNLAGLKQTAESVLAQTSHDYEWLVFDGGSTDGTKEFLEVLGDKVSYWESAPDGGVYNAMNKGIHRACGEYAIFMNSGDRFADEGVLSRVDSYAHDVGVVYGDWFDCSGEQKTLHPAPRRADFGFFCTDNICHQAMFIKTELLKRSEYDTTIGVYADWAKWIEFAAEGILFKYAPLTVCAYELGGISSKAAPFDEYARMVSALQKPYREKVIAVLLSGNRKFSTVASFLGISDQTRLSWLQRQQYKLCKKLCNKLRESS